MRRQRFLALCGWSMSLIRPGSSGSSTRGVSPPGRSNGAAADDGIVDATHAALQCDMCNARAGLWDFVPEMAAAPMPNQAAGGLPTCALPLSVLLLSSLHHHDSQNWLACEVPACAVLHGLQHPMLAGT